MLSKLFSGRALRYSSEFKAVQKARELNTAHLPKNSTNNIKEPATHIPPAGYISYSKYSPPSYALLIPNSIAQKTLQNRTVATPLVMKSCSHTNIPSLNIPISSCSQEIIPRNLLLLQNMASDVNYKLLFNNGSSQSSLQGFSQKKYSTPITNQNPKYCQNSSYNETIPPPPFYPAPTTLPSYSHNDITQKDTTQRTEVEKTESIKATVQGYLTPLFRSITRSSLVSQMNSNSTNEEECSYRYSMNSNSKSREENTEAGVTQTTSSTNQEVTNFQNTTFNEVPPVPETPSSCSDDTVIQQDATQRTEVEKLIASTKGGCYEILSMNSHNMSRYPSLTQMNSSSQSRESILELGVDPKRKDPIEHTNDVTQNFNTIVNPSSSNTSDTPTSSPTDIFIDIPHYSEEVVHNNTMSTEDTHFKNKPLAKRRYPKEKRFKDTTIYPSTYKNPLLNMKGLPKDQERFYQQIIARNARLFKPPADDIPISNYIDASGRALELTLLQRTFLQTLIDPTLSYRTQLTIPESLWTSANVLKQIRISRIFIQSIQSHKELISSLDILSERTDVDKHLAAYSTIIQTLQASPELQKLCYKRALDFDPNPVTTIVEKLVKMARLAKQYPLSCTKAKDPTKKKKKVTFRTHTDIIF